MTESINLDIQCPSQAGGEYIGRNNYSFCDKDIVLDQFNKTEDYEVFANDSLKPIMQKKKWKIFFIGMIWISSIWENFEKKRARSLTA